MTPEDVPAAITADAVLPWLHAIAPPVEPLRTPAPRSRTARDELPRPAAPEPLRPAA